MFGRDCVETNLRRNFCVLKYKSSLKLELNTAEGSRKSSGPGHACNISTVGENQRGKLH